MSLKHLTKGSQEPPKVDELLRLYSMKYCPYAQRTRLVLLAKNVPHDIVNINLQEKPEWYFKIHPQGIVPALATGSENIIESLVISDILDERYPNPPLYPKDPALKKKDQELIEKIADLTKVSYRFAYTDEKKTPEEWAEAFGPVLKPFESALAERGTTFFGGDRPGMVDYMLWPWSERTGVLKIALGQELPLPEEQGRLLKKWHKNMLEDPAVKATYNVPEKHWKVAQATLKKLKVNYDD